MQLQISIYTNRQDEQKLKFENVQKTKFEYLEDDFHNKNEKIEHEDVDAIVKMKIY